jgi:hypothetical protein
MQETCAGLTAIFKCLAWGVASGSRVRIVAAGLRARAFMHIAILALVEAGLPYGGAHCTGHPSTWGRAEVVALLDWLGGGDGNMDALIGRMLLQNAREPGLQAAFALFRRHDSGAVLAELTRRQQQSSNALGGAKAQAARERDAARRCAMRAAADDVRTKSNARGKLVGDDRLKLRGGTRGLRRQDGHRLDKSAARSLLQRQLEAATVEYNAALEAAQQPPPPPINSCGCLQRVHAALSDASQALQVVATATTEAQPLIDDAAARVLQAQLTQRLADAVLHAHCGGRCAAVQDMQVSKIENFCC